MENLTIKEVTKQIYNSQDKMAKTLAMAIFDNEEMQQKYYQRFKEKITRINNVVLDENVIGDNLAKNQYFEFLNKLFEEIKKIIDEQFKLVEPNEEILSKRIHPRVKKIHENNLRVFNKMEVSEEKLNAIYYAGDKNIFKILKRNLKKFSKAYEFYEFKYMISKLISEHRAYDGIKEYGKLIQKYKLKDYKDFDNMYNLLVAASTDKDTLNAEELKEVNKKERKLKKILKKNLSRSEIKSIKNEFEMVLAKVPVKEILSKEDARNFFRMVPYSSESAKDFIRIRSSFGTTVGLNDVIFGKDSKYVCNFFSIPILRKFEGNAQNLIILHEELHGLCRNRNTNPEYSLFYVDELDKMIECFTEYFAIKANEKMDNILNVQGKDKFKGSYTKMLPLMKAFEKCKSFENYKIAFVEDDLRKVKDVIAYHDLKRIGNIFTYVYNNDCSEEEINKKVDEISNILNAREKNKDAKLTKSRTRV